MSAKTERAKLIDNVKAYRAECQQILTDVAHWNEHVRNADEAPIDIDADHRLRDIIDGIDLMLAADQGTGPIASFIPGWFADPKSECVS